MRFHLALNENKSDCLGEEASSDVKERRAAIELAKEYLEDDLELDSYEDFSDLFRTWKMNPTKELYQIYVDTYNGKTTENDYKEDVQIEFEKMSSNDIIDLLGITNSSHIDMNSPMFILPDGTIISVEQVAKSVGLDLSDSKHSDMIYVILYAIGKKLGITYDVEDPFYEEQNLNRLTYTLDWARINCGSSWIESRFYCVLPNHMTSSQYRSLEKWLEWGYDNHKEEVLVFVSSYEDSNTYEFKDNMPEDIIKKIKRYYSSGKLYEHRNELKENMEELTKDFSKMTNPREGDVAVIIDSEDREWKFVAKYWSKPGFYPGMVWEGQKGNPWMSSFGTSQGTIKSEFPRGVKSITINGLNESMSTSIKPGDRVKMDYYAKPNNGATGTCKGRIGQLCFIEWDDGSKSKEITSYLTKIDNVNESSIDITNEVHTAVDRIMKNKSKYRNQDDLESAIYSAVSNVFSGMHGVTRDTADMIADVYEKELKRVELNSLDEEFVNELVPGELYHFIHNNKILYGTFKKKTPAWLFFDVEGKEVLAKPWTNVATTTEELEELMGLVDRMAKDTKIPSRVPNRFTRVPNQHGKPMGESADHYKNRLTKIVNNIASKIISDGWYKDYDDETTLHKEVVEFVKEILYSDNKDNYISENDYEFIKDEIEVAGIRNKNAYGGGRYEFDAEFCDSAAKKVVELSKMKTESNELANRAKKHKKKSKGMGWHMAVNAGDVEKGMEVFNRAASPSFNTNSGSGEGTAMGESVESNMYYYDGPVYYRGNKIATKSDITVTAKSLNVAIKNVLVKAAQGAKDLYNYDIVDHLVKPLTPDEVKPVRPKCQQCGYELNDIGDCPVCDYGEDDLLESLSDLEALWKLDNMF